MRLSRSKRIDTAEQLVKWMLCIPRFSTTSPRFEYYADNWHVLDKIQRFTASGEFDSMVKDCPAFSAEELRAALDYIDRSDAINKPHTTSTENPVQTLISA